MIPNTLDVAMLARLIAGMVLAVASVGKLLNSSWFVGVVREYRVVPVSWVRPVAAGLIFLEGTTSVALLTGTGLPWSAYAAAVLMLAFTAAIGVNLLRGRTEIQCGCMGPAPGQRISWHLISRNVGLLGIIWLGKGQANTSSSLGFSALLVCVVLFVASPFLSYSRLYLVRPLARHRP